MSSSDDRVSLRESWDFSFRTSEILAACKERHLSHLEHAKYWRGKFEEWDAEMSKTATVEDIPVTGGVQRSLRFDPGLQRKVNEARERRDTHATNALRFARWATALEKSNSSELKLRFADVSYFFEPIEDLPREEEDEQT